MQQPCTKLRTTNQANPERAKIHRSISEKRSHPMIRNPTATSSLASDPNPKDPHRLIPKKHHGSYRKTRVLGILKEGKKERGRIQPQDPKLYHQDSSTPLLHIRSKPQGVGISAGPRNTTDRTAESDRKRRREGFDGILKEGRKEQKGIGKEEIINEEVRGRRVGIDTSPC